MVSKIAAIGLVALLIAALIGGSVYILLRPGDVAVARNAGAYGWNNSGAEQQGDGYQGGRGGQGQSAARQGGNGYGGRSGAGQNRQEGSGTLGEDLADQPVETWTTLSGSALAVEDDELTIQTGDGPVTVHLGPEWYWEDQGIPLAEGDQVKVSGFYEDDTFELADIENLTSGETTLLRDEMGRPLWAGRRRGGRASGS